MVESTTRSFPQYPKLSELLQKISTHLNEDFSSKTVKARHESSISVLNRERSSFLKARIVQVGGTNFKIHTFIVLYDVA